MRTRAAVGDGWHVGIVTLLAAETTTVLSVLGIAAGRHFHTGRMAVPGGVTYLVAAPPAGPDGVTAALVRLCERYDPPVVALVGGADPPDVLLAGGRDPADRAVTAFFRAAGEPATLPGFRGGAPFLVRRGGGGDVARFCANATTRRGTPLAWVEIHGVVGDAAQTLRYLIPYLRL
ncbi:hypothetical protein [Actinophytocola sp.]|uniref:hypothetical protein n=1 Tax=Actinophytocola sp. TaxID=1872138 RepID=UPI002ED3227D